ncbi:MAG: glycosyltransferase [Chitinispirillales bacterium]|jgi:glycosyltransferase involved in cell wall biosynthesis|nr:glycosyltransferase [Chitinispirillales bacterium]
MKVDATICICTFKRPQMLRSLLFALNEQRNGGYIFDVNVVDNDSFKTARKVVEELSGSVGYKVRYFCEEEKNIALSRNMAVKNAVGEFVIFIDDDEFPDTGWLSGLIDICKKQKVDGVLGPVLPCYETGAPQWLKRSGLCDRKRLKTGTLMREPALMRTGNVLLKRSLFSRGLLFDKRFGLSGGEDSDFFARALLNGYMFVWCDEAKVYEHVPIERCGAGYHIKRAFLRGALNARRSKGLLNAPVLKSAAAVCAYSLMMPFMFFSGRHNVMKYLVKSCDHWGRLLGVFGIEPVKNRSFMENTKDV